MPRALSAVALLTLALCVAGCNRIGGGSSSGSSSGGGVAIIDMDEIASALGKDAEIQSAVRQAAEQRKGELESLRTALGQNIEAKRKEFGEAPTDDQKRELGMLIAAADQRMGQAVGEVNQQTQAQRMELVQAFRREVEPAAIAVANERGMDVIMVKQPGILHYELAADITDEVVAEMRKRQATAAVTPAPSTASTAASSTPPATP